MFGSGMTELLVIFVIGLLVLGPKRLPELARSLGRGLAEFRRASLDIRKEFMDVAEEANVSPAALEAQARREQDEAARRAAQDDTPPQAGQDLPADPPQAGQDVTESPTTTEPKAPPEPYRPHPDDTIHHDVEDDDEADEPEASKPGNAPRHG